MRWGKTVNDLFEWRYWFAWYPVRLNDHRRVWLEGVVRRDNSEKTTTTFRGKHYSSWHQYRPWEDYVRWQMTHDKDGSSFDNWRP